MRLVTPFPDLSAFIILCGALGLAHIVSIHSLNAQAADAEK